MFPRLAGTPQDNCPDIFVFYVGIRAESGVDWSVISAGTLIAVAPLLVAFLLFQRQFMQSFMQAGIK
jgi:ABC-type glycerol-3-phosphate transport system permease component